MILACLQVRVRFGCGWVVEFNFSCPKRICDGQQVNLVIPGSSQI